MRNFQRCCRLVAVLLLLIVNVFVPGLSLAQSAEELYAKGVALYEQGLYKEASAAFRRVLEIAPVPKVFYNIGECEGLAKRYDLAMEAFSAYLSMDNGRLDRERKKFAEEMVAEFSSIVGRLDIDEQASLEIRIDDESRGTTPIGKPLFVMEGAHEVALKDGDEIVLMQVVTVKGGDVVTVKRPVEERETEPVTAPPAPEETSSPPTSEEQESDADTVPSESDRGSRPVFKPLGFSMIGVGAAMLVAGVTTGALALSKANTLEERCPNNENCSNSNENLHDSGKRLAAASTVLLPMGGAAAVVGIALAVVGHRKSETRERPNDTGSNVDFTPTIGRTLSGLSITGRF